MRVCGTTISSRGLGIRIRFGLGRVGKNIHWQQSKRLLSGSLVVLMSADNKDVCKVAVVASRAMSNLEKEDGSLPEIDLFFGRDEDIDVDPLSEWIMVENRSGLFEAQRHTLVALQRMTFEQFPLSEHLVDLQTYIEPPPYLEDNPLRNLECVFPSDGRKSLQKVNVLQSWPEHPPSALDASQLSALERILTKKVATIQGPPGTGKTFVSVQALKVILSNMSSADPPVIVACQTNHALDQLLLHISQFEPLFARLGARSKDRDVILKRTIYELRKASKNPMSKGFKNFREAENNLVRLFRILESDKDLLTVDDFESFDILSPQQCESLRNSEWESSSTDSSPLKEWVGMNLREARAKYHAPLLEYEEVLDEWEVEEVQEHEAETGVAGGSGGADEDEMDVLKGTHIEFGGRLLNNGTKLSDPTIESELKKTRNMWKIQRGKRGAVYCYLQKKLKGAVARAIRDVLPSYHAAVKARRIGNLEADEIILRNQKVIGLTTTGLAKYRALIAALKPKVMFIEEAAETLEAPITIACVESLQHLVLVGDHKQLRPHCGIRQFEGPPYNLNISLFERLVDNNVEFSMLNQQRRMNPEIARLLRPIYGDNIQNHNDVLGGRPASRLFQDMNVWFFTHENPDERDSMSSSFNSEEAKMIFGLIKFMSYNGVDSEHMTVLTFYNGQRRRFNSLLKKAGEFWTDRLSNIKVVTIDSYQGEENEFVFLSLVRNNEEGSIGFTGNENRVCVALSRARRGLFVFGNGEMMCGASEIWANVVREVHNNKKSRDPVGRRIGYYLHLQCKTHMRKFYIQGTYTLKAAVVSLLWLTVDGFRCSRMGRQRWRLRLALQLPNEMWTQVSGALSPVSYLNPLLSSRSLLMPILGGTTIDTVACNGVSVKSKLAGMCAADVAVTRANARSAPSIVFGKVTKARVGLVDPIHRTRPLVMSATCYSMARDLKWSTREIPAAPIHHRRKTAAKPIAPQTLKMLQLKIVILRMAKANVKIAQLGTMVPDRRVSSDWTRRMNGFSSAKTLCHQNRAPRGRSRPFYAILRGHRPQTDGVTRTTMFALPPYPMIGSSGLGNLTVVVAVPTSEFMTM